MDKSPRYRLAKSTLTLEQQREAERALERLRRSGSGNTLLQAVKEAKKLVAERRFTPLDDAEHRLAMEIDRVAERVERIEKVMFAMIGHHVPTMSVAEIRALSALTESDRVIREWLAGSGLQPDANGRYPTVSVLKLKF